MLAEPCSSDEGRATPERVGATAASQTSDPSDLAHIKCLKQASGQEVAGEICTGTILDGQGEIALPLRFRAAVCIWSYFLGAVSQERSCHGNSGRELNNIERKTGREAGFPLTQETFGALVSLHDLFPPSFQQFSTDVVKENSLAFGSTESPAPTSLPLEIFTGL